MTYRKKLIEVALPLEAINKESAREKSIRHGHPSTLHLWWARRPLAACRAVLFASLVDDPSSHPEQFPTEESQEKERQRLFRIIEELVKWENSNNETVLQAAREEIAKSTGGNPPPVLDPFCGGGSIPLEAQRLGLEAHASDLNPVAVLITKALIEIPPKFANRPPVHPAKDKRMVQREWKGAQGLAEDVRYYGQWMRDEAEKRIGHLYPKVKLPKEHGGGEATVIAWLWARTVKCPNPACGAQMPLVRSFALSTKTARQAWVEPIVDKHTKIIRFEVSSGSNGPIEGTVNRRGARCIVCGQPVPFDHVRTEGKGGRITAQMMAIVAQRRSGRIYLPPITEHISVAASAIPTWRPEASLPHNPRDFKTPNYGMNTFADLFTPRQLVALTTFSDLVVEARERVAADARKAGMRDDGRSLQSGASGALAYSDAVATYLGFVLSKVADRGSSLTRWMTSRDSMYNTFARQALPMVWDYVEVNALGEQTGGWSESLRWTAESLEGVRAAGTATSVLQHSASEVMWSSYWMFCTDPPYYDNIGYADLSDFFYVWLRRSLNDIYPDLFSTLLAPKAQELVATPYRFSGDRMKAQEFFEKGLAEAFGRMRNAQHSDYPLTVYYAFKQSESEDEDGEDGNGRAKVFSTGWETMLEGLLRSGLGITGTWPMRTELSNRLIASGTNALASSIVLACRPRAVDAPLATRREFAAVLKKDLPDALRRLQHGNVAPVDLAQAAIGPGMAVFPRYSKVVEADGSPMSVRTALQIINQELDAYLAEQEGEMDRDTRFCLAWFEQFGLSEGAFGEADVLARAKDTSVQGLVEAGVAFSKAGKFRLLKRDELLEDWDPATDERLTLWECTQYLIQQLSTNGERGAANLAAKLGGGLGEEARNLAYRLYSICDKKKWSQEAQVYNSLVIAWPEITRLAQSIPAPPEQGRMNL